MTKKHFIAIARILKEHKQEFVTPGSHAEGANDGIIAITEALADYFHKENPNFDRDRFIKACD